MNSDLENIRKKHRRSSSYSSSDSRSRSRDRDRDRDKKKSKKDKKHRRSRSKSKEKSKRKRSKSSKRAKKSKVRKRSKSRSRSKDSADKMKYPQTIAPMDNMMGGFMYYPPVMPNMPQMSSRNMRPPMFFPHYPPEAYRNMRQPHSTGQTNQPSAHSKAPIETPQTLEQPPDKIVKDQNFLNSDEKLFESIVNSETHIRTLFEDSQISELYSGTTLYKTVKKMLHDPNTVIFENDKFVKSNETWISTPKPNEIIRLEIENYLNKNSLNKLSINLGDLTSIREELEKYRQSQKNK
jgi:hypothetical protein